MIKNPNETPLRSAVSTYWAIVVFNLKIVDDNYLCTVHTLQRRCWKSAEVWSCLVLKVQQPAQTKLIANSSKSLRCVAVETAKVQNVLIHLECNRMTHRFSVSFFPVQKTAFFDSDYDCVPAKSCVWMQCVRARALDKTNIELNRVTETQ